MERVVKAYYCDIDYARNNRLLVIAENIETDLGILGNVDICDACLELLRKTFETLMTPDSQDAEQDVPADHTEPGADRTPLDVLLPADGSAEWFTAFREWMDANGLRYKFTTGTTYNPKYKNRFREHLKQLREKRDAQLKSSEGG